MFEMSNREIRQRAWELCRANFWKILGASLFISMIVTVGLALCALLGAVGIVLAIAMMVALLPMLEVGLVQFTSNLWNGEFAGIGTLFSHADRIPRILGVLFQTGLWYFLATLPFMLAMAGLMPLLANGSTAAMIPVWILMIVMIITMIWLALRLSLAIFVLVLNPSAKASECIRTSWNATRRNVWRIFCHTFILSLPMLAVEILSQCFLYVSTPTEFTAAIFNIIVMLFSSLFNGYITLGQYGLAQQLIQNAPTR